jgi:hypothetical protein
MMTSLHSYVAFGFVRVSPKKNDEDCANYLIGLQSMMPAGLLAGDARESPGSYRGATREPPAIRGYCIQSSVCNREHCAL